MINQSYDDRICVAEWNMDMGRGQIFWPSGARYEGEMDKDGDRQGDGIWTSADGGETKSGRWESDEL